MRRQLTIVTPTYNRKQLLRRLYESLVAQTRTDFIWFVIDDGSTDGTEEEVGRFISESKIEILYQKQENGGKHRALNRAIAQIETELTFIVDSDDYLPKDAVEIILSYHQKYKPFIKNDCPYGKLCGYSFLRCYEDGSVNTAYFKKDEEIAAFRDVRINGGIGGDKAEVFYTEILKQYPFPEYVGEKFLPEDLVWMQMSGPYRMVHVNRCVYISEYLDGGLTKSGRAMKIHSPRGMMERSLVYLQDPQVKASVKLKMLILYQIYGRFAGQCFMELMRGLPEGGAQRAAFVLLWIPTEMLYHLWK